MKLCFGVNFSSLKDTEIVFIISSESIVGRCGTVVSEREGFEDSLHPCMVKWSEGAVASPNLQSQPQGINSRSLQHHWVQAGDTGPVSVEQAGGVSVTLALSVWGRLVLCLWQSPQCCRGGQPVWSWGSACCCQGHTQVSKSILSLTTQKSPLPWVQSELQQVIYQL